MKIAIVVVFGVWLSACSQAPKSDVKSETASAGAVEGPRAPGPAPEAGVLFDEAPDDVLVKDETYLYPGRASAPPPFDAKTMVQDLRTQEYIRLYQLIVTVKAQARVNEFNKMLTALNARIVQMKPKSKVLIIQFPAVGSLKELDQFMRKLKGYAFVANVVRVPAPKPPTGS